MKYLIIAAVAALSACGSPDSNPSIDKPCEYQIVAQYKYHDGTSTSLMKNIETAVAARQYVADMPPTGLVLLVVTRVSVVCEGAR